MARKICVVTGSRAEYGLLYWVMKAIEQDGDLDLKVVVTGMHLSSEFGLTYRQIESDGFVIDRKVEMLLSSDSAAGVGKSMGLGLIGFAEVFSEMKPDIVLILGDRFEIFSVAAAAMVCKVPIAHCHGGERTEGAMDEAIRHSITKMAHLHFVSTEAYRRRVIQLGEDPGLVFNTGALGIENITRLRLLPRSELEEQLDFSLDGRINIMVTFHPATLDESDVRPRFQALLDALEALEGGRIIFTGANADEEGRVINSMIEAYVSRHANCIAVPSLGQLKYLSALQFVDIVIGNSSSGLIEVPSFKKATINIGDRQKGRIRGTSVIDCGTDRDEIARAITYAMSLEFQKVLETTLNPYDGGWASEKILATLKRVDLGSLIKKRFHDRFQETSD